MRKDIKRLNTNVLISNIETIQFKVLPPQITLISLHFKLCSLKVRDERKIFIVEALKQTIHF